MKLHENEVEITLDVAHKLLVKQFPIYASLPLSFLDTQGTDNVMFALGDDKVMRLPRIKTAALNLQKEIDILPKFKSLPLEVPHIIEKGVGEDFYPFPWLICSKLSGHAFRQGNQGICHEQDAHRLAQFIKGLQKTPPKGPKSSRGQGLKTRHKQMLEAISLMGDMYDENLLTQLWQQSIGADGFQGNPVWTHSDLHLGNVLIDEKGYLSGIVDFGMAGLGDPAVDLMAAWTLLEPEARKVFQEITAADEATWLRARGWALCLGAVAYPYYKDTHPYFANIAKRAIDQIILDIKA